MGIAADIATIEKHDGKGRRLMTADQLFLLSPVDDFLGHAVDASCLQQI